MDIKISLRPVTIEDDEFLCAVYSSTRRDEVAAFGWDLAQAEAFLRMQFTARAAAYKMQFPHAEHSIILFDDKSVGSMIVDRQADSIRLTDIAVLPEYRKHGIGTYLIKQLQNEAANSNKPMVLRVDKTNIAAKEFYEKNDFVVIGETQILHEMEWRA